MTSLALNFLGGAPFQLLYEGVMIAIRKTKKCRTLLQNLEFTLECLQPRIVQQISANNVQLNIPNDLIRNLETKMAEGKELVDKLSELGIWNIRIWGNCCNCIKPNYAKQLAGLDRSLRRLLEILKLEQISNSQDNLILARNLNDKQDELDRKLSELLKVHKELLKAQKEMYDMTRVQHDAVHHTMQRILGEAGPASAPAPSPAPAPAPALGKEFQKLFDVVIQVKVNNTMCERLIREFKSTLDFLIPLIEEVADCNKVLQLPEQEQRDFITQMKEGVELIRKCSKVCKWASYKKYECTNKLIKLDESLQVLFHKLSLQIAKHVKEALVSITSMEAVIKKIEGSGVVQNQIQIVVAKPEPPLHEAGLDVLKTRGRQDVEGTTDDMNEKEVGVEQIEGNGLRQNVKEIEGLSEVPETSSPITGLDVLNMHGRKDVEGTRDDMNEKEVGVKQIEGNGNKGLDSERRNIEAQTKQIEGASRVVEAPVAEYKPSFLDEFKTSTHKILVTSRSEFPQFGSPDYLKSEKSLNDEDTMTDLKGKKLKRGLWSPEEDEKLSRYITTHGLGSCSEVPEKAGPQRSAKRNYVEGDEVSHGLPAVEMASSTAGPTGWLRGRVKAVTSGDCLVIMALTSSKPGPPPEKTITLSSLMAPKLARRGGIDEPFAWESREFLRKLCIGKDVTFKVNYTVSSMGSDFGSVFLGDKNVAMLVVSQGWAKVREQPSQPKQGQQKVEASPFIAELLQLEEQAKTQGLGRWSKVPGASEASIRNLPPSAIGDPSKLDAMSLLAANKGKPMEAIVEQVRDGSTVRVYLLPEFQFVQVFVAGIQAPSVGRRPITTETVPEPEITSDKTNGDVSAEPRAPLTSAQRIAASTASTNETVAVPFAPEAKYFTEIRVLNRDVRIVLEGVDKFSNLIGSVYYPDGDSAKDLALELVENGYAKYVEWSANMMEEEPKRRLKTAELQAKKSMLRIWTNYVPPATNSKPIHNQNFTGKVVEVVSGDCVIVADDSVPYGSPLAERRVNLSSIRCPKMGNPRRDEKPAPYAREAKEFLRTRLIGRQVNVQMEYSRKINPADGAAVANGPADSRIMDFGSVFLATPSKAEGEEAATSASSASQQAGVNVAELVIARGFGTVIRHRDFEERSSYYDALLSAESRATTGKKGVHSSKDPPVMHITDLTTASAKKARDFLPFLHRSRRIPAVVEYVLSGHRFKLLIPKETCSIAFSFSGVRCPGRDEPYSDEAIALMRRRIMQRDVEIEVETVDRTGTFLGSLWESRTNMAIALVEAGLAKFTSFAGSDRIPDAHLLEQAEKSAKKQKLKIWENYVEGEEVSNGLPADKQKEVLNVMVTEVLGGGQFYVQTVGDQKISSIQQQLAALNLQEAPIIGAYNPKKGDIVLAQFSADNSWNRAMIVNAPRGPVESPKDKFEVFYIDYGNQEVVPYSHLRPLDSSVSSAPGLAQLCSLAHVKVQPLEKEYGQDAAEYLSELTLNSSKEFRAMIEDRDLSGGKVKGQGTGPVLLITLVAVDAEISVNAAMLQDGWATLEKMKRYDTKDRKTALENLEKFQEEARVNRRGMWQYGHYDSDEEDVGPPVKKGAGK